MKQILSILAIMLLGSCVVKQKGNDGISGKDGGKSQKIKISAQDVKTSMEYLASDELQGRATGSKGIEKAAVFIENFFKENNIKSYFETYRDTFNVGELVGYNVVGVIEGNDPNLKNEFIILGGHYDHIGKGKEVNGDGIANGANDDASGTITAMELGRYFSKSKTNKRSILITLYDAEELGLKGSSHLAKRLKDEDLNVYAMLNFEMVGVPRSSDKSMAYISGYDRSNFAPILNKYADEEIIGFFPKAKDFQLFFRSDNFPFYKAFNIPAQAISTFDFTNFDYYHHVDDEADKMDYEHMANFINKMIVALEGMMNASTKEVILNDE
ncbi:M28 family peptidase [Winogradskyella sp.]|jgi:Zn-dependent M28 family amino/carboxypeptidase|uniref:M28 family metallopeptidase n=1 Tax=Winogradskyella sp. TaxID=1883156 RepID=UPI0025FC4527|nr:M28 family peptidase [Winogradskyella sp.]MCT4630263.1 M28 family peptidase [Winogradskyella sp.]